MGEKCDADAMIALLNYREDGITPYMLFFRDGLIEEKQVSVFWIYVHWSFVSIVKEIFLKCCVYR